MTRINFKFEGGPLDGQELRHRQLPAKPEESILYKLTTGPKEAGIAKDQVAQGRYHLDNRDGLWVAVHDKSDDDQPWRELEVQPPVKKPKEKARVAFSFSTDPEKAKNAIKIPDDSPGAKKFAPFAKAILAMKKLKEERELKEKQPKPPE
jgi:hypothetical protein